MTTAQRVVLTLLALSLAAGMMTGGTIFYRLSYLWGFIFFGGWLWSVLSLRGLEFHRSTRSLRAQVGQIFEERYEIQNKNRLPRLWVEIRDESSLPGARGSHVLTLIGGRSGRSYLVRTRLVRRGVFPLGPTALASGDVFGMFPVERWVPTGEALLVYPTMITVQTFPSPPGLLPGGEALRRRTRQVTPNAAGVREYSPGDALNYIHWVSTARRDRLMVKEFELDPLADVWILLDAERAVQSALPTPPLPTLLDDFWRRAVKIPLPPSTEEYGVSIAASLARYFLRRRRAVGLIAAAQHTALIPPDRGGRQLGKILEALALFEADGEAPLRGLVETQARYLPRGSTVICITPSAHEEVYLAVDHLIRLGLRPVVVLIDAVTFGGEQGLQDLAPRLNLLGVPVCHVSNGDDLEKALSDDTLEWARRNNHVLAA